MDVSLFQLNLLCPLTHTVLSLLVMSHDSMLRQSLKFIAFFLCHTLHVMPAATLLLFSSNILMGKLE